MASALMAFVQGLGAEKQDNDTATVQDEKKPTPPQEADEVDDADDEDMFGDSGDEQTPPQKAPTLLEVAKQEVASASPSLMEVAKSLEVEVPRQQSDQPKPTLAAIAAEMNQEEVDRETSQAQFDKVQRALDTVSSEVRAERVAHRNEEVVSGLKAAVGEQQQQYEDEDFEDDAASVRAAAEALAASVAKAKSVGHRSPSRVRSKPLKKGPTSSQSLSKLELQRAMQDKLSAFQFQQLSITQRRIFLASLAQADSANNSKPKKRVANREALNELAKDKFTQARQKQKPRHEFARLDDNRHCRFTPRLHNSSSKKKLSNNDSDDDEGPGGSRGAALRRNEDFVRRMEAAERARREQLRRTREEAAYLARVDKKECPSCGNPQSYSELTQKRKKCPNCGVTYKSRIAWSDVAKEFLTRMEEFQQSCKERQRERQEESERQEALSCRPEDDEEDAKKTWEDVRDEFLGRLQLDLEYREMSRAVIWEEIQRECSFSPSITRRAQQLEIGDFDERLRRDLDERRLRREQLAARAEAAAAREREFERRNASSKSKKHITPSAPFQERLRQDLAKRRAREKQQRW
ncbi:hypothetical protein PHYSODRAFT_334448 [Phytophthora sojae]|uniref:Uncharacterized protein n=1 Tax=Phytophthora sojae (strain P6497) TaxID=1094619 RepID=G4ZM67_PHYSP|nr:hypothetical protein PHYSODRAFT_334448 [Phytophthora sojae]EGZ16274.1 hypothetical protein PHYSODRAFT_334448 [Phytophthora sojae]|eukprot:XP_009530023.1 hypothetical protein PHYSODRAFT_334448 [Phytophthora sojae]